MRDMKQRWENFQFWRKEIASSYNINVPSKIREGGKTPFKCYEISLAMSEIG